MNTRLFVAMALASVLAVPSMAIGQVPAEVPVQGFLTDDTGVPVDGSVSVEFKIYDALTGGTELHSETISVDADAGAFTVYLTPSLTIFEQTPDIYLGLSVDGEAEMSPRLKMATVPYAAVAGDAATVVGMSAADFAPSDYQPDWDDLQSVPGDLADGDDDTTYTAGSGVEIDAQGAIALNSGCSTTQVLKWDGGQWTCQFDVDTTYVAGYGLRLTSNQFEVDFAEVQQRVFTTCAPDDKMIGINVDGTVQCETDNDTDTTYSAGAGLAMSGTTFSVAADGITSTEVADGTLRNADIANSAGISPHKIAGTAATLDSSPNFNGSVAASDFNYGTSKTGYLTLGAAAFTVSSSTEDDTWNIGQGSYGFVSSAGSDSVALVSLTAAVSLPVGVEVTSFECYGYDNDSANNVRINTSFRRIRLLSAGSTSSEVLAAVTLDTSGASTAMRIGSDTSILNSVIDSEYSYWVSASVHQDAATSRLRTYGCKIGYTADAPSF